MATVTTSHQNVQCRQR